MGTARDEGPGKGRGTGKGKRKEGRREEYWKEAPIVHADKMVQAGKWMLAVGFASCSSAQHPIPLVEAGLKGEEQACGTRNTEAVPPRANPGAHQMGEQLSVYLGRSPRCHGVQ